MPQKRCHRDLSLEIWRCVLTNNGKLLAQRQTENQNWTSAFRHGCKRRHSSLGDSSPKMESKKKIHHQKCHAKDALGHTDLTRSCMYNQSQACLRFWLCFLDMHKVRHNRNDTHVKREEPPTHRWRPWYLPITVDVPIVINLTFLQHVQCWVCPPDNVICLNWEGKRAFCGATCFCLPQDDAKWSFQRYSRNHALPGRQPCTHLEQPKFLELWNLSCWACQPGSFDTSSLSRDLIQWRHYVFHHHDESTRTFSSSSFDEICRNGMFDASVFGKVSNFPPMGSLKIAAATAALMFNSLIVCSKSLALHGQKPAPHPVKQYRPPRHFPLRSCCSQQPKWHSNLCRTYSYLKLKCVYFFWPFIHFSILLLCISLILMSIKFVMQAGTILRC